MPHHHVTDKNKKKKFHKRLEIAFNVKNVRFKSICLNLHWYIQIRNMYHKVRLGAYAIVACGSSAHLSL